MKHPGADINADRLFCEESRRKAREKCVHANYHIITVFESAITKEDF